MRTEDGYLVDQCLDGDSAAFGLLVDTYRSSIYALAYSRVRNFHDAEDLAQETFIKAYRNLRTLNRGDNFRAWVYSITSNLCKNFLRSKSRQLDGEFIDDQAEEFPEPTGTDDTANDSMRELLHEALTALPEMYRDVLTLHYLGEMKSREIARFLGTSKNTVDTRLRRARTYLKKEMLTMMTATFEGHRLQPSFTFRIVEMMKETKIQPAPHSPALPLGLSITGILIVALLSFTVPFSPLFPMGQWIGSALPSKMQVPEIGVIPVDTIEITEITILSSEKGDGDFGQKPKPDPMNAFAPPGQEGEWAKRADMPTRNWALAASAVKGKIYVIGGGGNRKNTPRATVEAYDPVTDTWTRKADMPTARQRLSTSVVNERIYALGGNRGDNGQKLRTLEAYDPLTDTWQKKADMLIPRVDLSTSVVDGKIYAIGGWDGFNSVSTLEMYDPATDTWTKKRDMPTERNGLRTVALDGKIYAFGGWSKGKYVDIVEVYDPATDRWAARRRMPVPNFGFGIGLVNGKIYIVAGSNENNYLTRVDIYNPETDTWTADAAPHMPTPRTNTWASVVDGKIYVFGGYDGRQVLSAVEAFDTGGKGNSQSVNPVGKLPTLWAKLKSRN